MVVMPVISTRPTASAAARAVAESLGSNFLPSDFNQIRRRKHLFSEKCGDFFGDGGAGNFGGSGRRRPRRNRCRRIRKWASPISMAAPARKRAQSAARAASRIDQVGGENAGELPVFLGHEFLDFQFAIHHEFDRHRLHPAVAEGARGHFFHSSGEIL